MIISAYTRGIIGHLCTIGWDLAGSLGQFTQTGVRESSFRAESAIRESNLGLIKGQPTNTGQWTCGQDLAIALAQLGIEAPNTLVLGELSLSGQLRACRGVLPMVETARNAGFTAAIVPRDNAREAGFVTGIKIYGADHLTQVVDFLLPRLQRILPFQGTPQEFPPVVEALSFNDVKGLDEAKAALVEAAQTDKNILLVGPPGSGKTMLARRFHTLLPSMTLPEVYETTRIYSVCGLPHEGIVNNRPFRAPHHTISDVGMMGGGISPVKPGEASLAHNGVLYLDELPEFRRAVLEVLGKVTEDESVAICRRGEWYSFPAKTRIIASMNACPCGYKGSSKRACTCSEAAVERYTARVAVFTEDFIKIPVLA